MGTYMALALLLLITALLSRGGAQLQSPSLTEFAAFCNEVGTSGGPPNPFIEVLCRQVAERITTEPPPSATTSWFGAEALNVSDQSPSATTGLGTLQLTHEAGQVTVKQANDSGVIPQETHHISDTQSRGNETLIVDSALRGADNATDGLHIGRGQSIIVLNNTYPQEQVDLEVSGGSNHSSNIEESITTTDKASNTSVLQPVNKLLHIVPYNISTIYVGERAQSGLVDDGGRNGRNITRAFQTSVTNLKALKRGDQVPVPQNKSSDSPAVIEISRNQTLNNTEILHQLPDVGPQQSPGEEGLLFQQSDIPNSNETLSINQSTGIYQVLDKEQKNVLADSNNATLDSISEGQVNVEQLLTVVTSETEVPTTTSVAKDDLKNSSRGSNVTGLEVQDVGRGSNVNGSSSESGIQVAEVNNSTQVAADVRPEPETIKDAPSSIDGLFEFHASKSQNISTEVIDTIQTTTGKLYEQIGTEGSLSGKSLGNEQPSAQGTNGGQITVDQVVQGVPRDSANVDTQSVQGGGNNAPKIEPAVDLPEENVVTTESTILSTDNKVVNTQNPPLINNEGTKRESPVILGETLGNHKPTAVQSTGSGMNTTVPSNNLTSEQNLAGGQETLVAKPAESSYNRPGNLTSQTDVVDLSPQPLPDVMGGSDPTRVDTQQTNQETSLQGGISSSDSDIKSSTQFSVSGSTFAGSSNQVPIGVSSSVGNSVASPSLTPIPAGSTDQSPAGMSSSEWNSAPLTPLPSDPAGSTNQFPVGLSSSERKSVASASHPPNPTRSSSQPSAGVSSSEGSSVGAMSTSPTPEGQIVRDSILLLKELSSKFLEDLAAVHCRLSVDDFWKNVTEVFRRASFSHKPTMRDMVSSVVEVIESYRRESPYWQTIAAKLEEATSDLRWRQLLGSVAERRRGDFVAQLRLLSVSRQLREAVRAAITSPECRAPGAQAFAGSCERFVLCYRAGWRWNAQSLSCPRGSAFSLSERRCVWRPLADCRLAPSFGHWGDEDSDSDSDSSDSDSDSFESEERSWSLFGHAHSLFQMFDFRH